MARQRHARRRTLPRKPGSLGAAMSDHEIYDANSRRRPLDELGWTDCKWPVNRYEDDGRHLFCGAPSAIGSSYCTHHRMRAKGSGTEGEKSAARDLVRAA
ncbi:GcrA family cell cycle regulator [Aliihoeflea sp. PC F10.4]